MAKKFLSIGLLLFLFCSLAACGNNNQPTPNGTVLERYSINAEAVENLVPTSSMDLSFLADQEQLLVDNLWLDQNRLLLLTANPAEEDENGGTLPQNLYFYILHTGDNSLELIYTGRHLAGKLQKLSGNAVAVQAYGSMLFFDYNKAKVTFEFALDVESEQTADLVTSATGDLMAYSDSHGSIHLLDGMGQEVALTEPKSLGYNWLSSPIWSKSGDALAFFCGYEPFGVDAIGILAADKLNQPYTLQYHKTSDSFPAWPHDKNAILVLNNFHIPAENAVRSIEIINWKTNKSINLFKLPQNTDFISLAYANPSENVYYITTNGNLYSINPNNGLEQMNPSEAKVYEDNVKFSASAARIAISENDENGYLHSIYIIGLSPFVQQ